MGVVLVIGVVVLGFASFVLIPHLENMVDEAYELQVGINQGGQQPGHFHPGAAGNRRDVNHP